MCAIAVATFGWFAGPRDGGEPRARGLRSDRDVDLRRFDRLDTPTVRERLTDLALGDPARPPPLGLLLAETEHVVVTANTYCPSEAGDERCPVLVVEHMEETAVEHHVELLIKDCRLRASPTTKRADAPRSAAFASAHRLAPRLHRHQRMLAGTASNIEHSPSQPAVRSEGRERRLRRTDVPRRGKINWVQIDLGADDHDHFIDPEERLRIAMAR